MVSALLICGNNELDNLAYARLYLWQQDLIGFGILDMSTQNMLKKTQIGSQEISRN